MKISEILGEHIVYADNPEPFKGGKTPYDELDATSYYVKHFSNLMYLEFIFKHTNDWKEKQQASKETAVAHRKMEYWKKHPNFDREDVERRCAEIRKHWLNKEIRERPTDKVWMVQHIRKVNLFWNRDTANWVSKDRATKFNQEEKSAYQTPMGGKWVKPKLDENLEPMPEELRKVGMVHGFNSIQFKQAEQEWVRASKNLTGPDDAFQHVYSNPWVLAGQYAREGGTDIQNLIGGSWRDRPVLSDTSNYDRISQAQPFPRNKNRLSQVKG